MVAMNVWPTDAGDGSVSNEPKWRKMARAWSPSAVVAGVASELLPTLAAPNLTVRTGAAWVDGHYCELVADAVLAVTANGLVVVRFDPTANSAEVLWRDGATTPTQAPAGVWELPIARITANVMTDLRVVFQWQQAANDSVARFANAGTRTLAIPAPVLNQLSVLDSSPGIVQYWTGSAWANLVPPIPVVPPAAPWPLPAGHYIQSGNIVVTTDVFGSANAVYGYAFAAPATVVGIEAGNLNAEISIISYSASGATFNIRSSNGAPVASGLVRIHYIAIGVK